MERTPELVSFGLSLWKRPISSFDGPAAKRRKASFSDPQIPTTWRRERKTKRAALEPPIGSRMNDLRNYWTNRIIGKFASHNSTAPKTVTFVTRP